MKGRKPKPTEIKRREGAYVHDPQREPVNEPEAPPGWPPVPTHLSPEALTFWNEACRRMEELNTLSPVYGPTLEAYAHTYARWREAERLLSAGILIPVEAKEGRPGFIVNPVANQAHKFRDALLRYESELGLTPSSKSRVSAIPQLRVVSARNRA